MRVVVFQRPPATLPGKGELGPSWSSMHACLQAMSPGFSDRRKMWTEQEMV